MKLKDRYDVSDVRPLTRDDLEWVGRLWLEEENILGPYYRLGQKELGDWKAADNFSRRLIGVPKIAFAVFRVNEDGSMYLAAMAVDKQARRRGLAKAMLDYFDAPMTLSTFASNDPAVALYKRNGFRVVRYGLTKRGKRLLCYMERPGREGSDGLRRRTEDQGRRG